jgi:putative DNA primase/helicase
MNPSIPTMHHAVQAVCSRHEAHPIKSFIGPLKWDGKPRLVQLLRRMGCESTPDGLSEVYGVKWAISAIARAMEPGCQVDSVLILAGAKGLGKTSAFRVLAGIQWHAESVLRMGDRDAYQQLQGVWIYELGELDSLRRSEVSAVKQFITARYDKFRPSYGRNVVERARQCVFCGTTNDATFLPETDRRWWVRKVVERADLAWLEENREQIWAEAKHRYDAGEQWHLDAEESARQELDVAAYRHEDPWEQVIDAYIKRLSATRVTVNEVLRHAVGKREDQMEKGDEMRVGRLLAAIGWSKRKAHGVSVWVKPGTPGDTWGTP